VTGDDAMIYDIRSIPAAELGYVGGKARGLNQLAACGLNVPDGFVVTDAGGEAAADEAAAYYTKRGLKKVAVRSSATAEDGPDFSSAGQYDTYLNVEGSGGVRQAVRDCAASLHGVTAQKYSSIFSGSKSAQMCVVVQKMADAEVSGVCFTQHPDGRGGLLIEAVEGLGEALVSGRATAAACRVDEKTLEAPDCGFLSASLVRNIAAGALKARTHIGRELDIEWAARGDEVFWLQARPITVTDEPDAFELDNTGVKDDDVVTTYNVGEMLPGAVTPLSISTSVYGIDYGMRKMIAHVGGAKRMDDIPPGSCVTNFGNHLFINISSLYAIADYVAGATREGVELSLCGRLLENIPQPPVPKVSKLAKMNNARKYFTMILRTGRACRKLKELADKANVPARETAHEQLKEITDRLWMVNEAFWLHYITSGHSGSMSSALFLILMADGCDADTAKAKIAGVLEDIDGIESVDILRSLRRVARALLAEKPDIASLNAHELAGYLKTCGPESRQAMDDFLKRHGHRAIREAELRSQSWHADEESLCNYLKTVIATGAEETAKTRMVDKNIDALLSEQKGLLRWMTKSIIGQARKGVVNREYTKSQSIRVVDQFKTAYRRLADLMVCEGLLADADLIFFLQHDEIVRLVDGGELGLVKRAMARRRLLEQQKTFRFDEVCVGRPRPKLAIVRPAEGAAVLAGTSLSHGVATGRARVVRSVDEANSLEPGEIMVAAFTDIGWSPYYCMLEALVTEVGSALSHGAVVAREYALPLVSNVAYATEVIRTGDMISVDGTAGTVAIIE
jgi:phosphohistidine swiveling domain-containing protein